MKKEILLNDLNCIIINSPKTIEVELNEERKMMSSDDIFYKLNFNDIEYIEVNEDSSYVKFENGQELVILHGSEHLDNDINKEVLVEYIKFLEHNGEKLAKAYRNIMG